MREFGKLLKVLWVPFARAIAFLVCSFVLFPSFYSRLGDNRADEGEICRVENGPISRLSYFLIVLHLGCYGCIYYIAS